MSDTLRKAWRDLKAGEDPGDAGRAALREHERRLDEATARPRITNGAFQAAEKYAKRHGVSVGALLDQLIQAKVAGELIEAHRHFAGLQERERRILELEHEIDRVERRREAEKGDLREARLENYRTMDAWFASLERRIAELDFVGVPEPKPENFLGPSERDTTTEHGGVATG